MICGTCGKRMRAGKFKALTMQSHPTMGFFEGDKLVATSDEAETLGFYCPDCDVMLGVYFRSKIYNFPSGLDQDLDDAIDTLPKKVCPECGLRLDIDYPRCPECGCELQ